MPKSQAKDATLGKVLRLGQKSDKDFAYDLAQFMSHAMEMTRLEDSSTEPESQPLRYQLSGIHALQHPKRGFAIKVSHQDQEAATEQKKASEGHVLSLKKRDS